MEILSAYRLGLAKFQAIVWTEKKNTRTNETCFINSWKCDKSELERASWKELGLGQNFITGPKNNRLSSSNINIMRARGRI